MYLGRDNHLHNHLFACVHPFRGWKQWAERASNRSQDDLNELNKRDCILYDGNIVSGVGQKCPGHKQRCF